MRLQIENNTITERLQEFCPAVFCYIHMVSPRDYRRAATGNGCLDDHTRMMYLSDKDGNIKDTIFIAKFGYAMMTLRNGPDRSGSGAKSLMLG